MESLIIYDIEGFIIQVTSMDYRIPIGVPYLEVEMPPNSVPVRVNVDGEVHFVEYAQQPRSKVEELEEIIEEQNAALFEIGEMLHTLMNGGGNE